MIMTTITNNISPDKLICAAVQFQFAYWNEVIFYIFILEILLVRYWF